MVAFACGGQVFAHGRRDGVGSKWGRRARDKGKGQGQGTRARDKGKGQGLWVEGQGARINLLVPREFGLVTHAWSFLLKKTPPLTW